MGRTAFCTIVIGLLCLGGCASGGGGAADRFGKTIYLDGAGNWGFGASEIPGGLREAGYQGDVEIYIWTTSLSPLIDQLNIPGAKLRAGALAQRIKRYRRRYPDNQVNLIALSAGTGVAIWAIEQLDEESKVHNVVLLGSSLSHDYDVTKALRNITGNIYVYHSSHDAVLAGVMWIGTIDGKRGVKSVGTVGLTPPRGMEDRVINIPWSRRYVRYGWTGAHTDCTSKPFVRAVLSKHIIGRRTTGSARSAVVTRAAASAPVMGSVRVVRHTR